MTALRRGDGLPAWFRIYSTQLNDVFARSLALESGCVGRLLNAIKSRTVVSVAVAGLRLHVARLVPRKLAEGGDPRLAPKPSRVFKFSPDAAEG